jgi:photosystem II stability/assembly factor-like uncharacterized protein
MKTGYRSINLITVVIFLSISFSQCERDYFSQDYDGMYGTWIIRNISGGFSGGGMEANFDVMTVSKKMHYSLYREDILISDGRIDIIEQTNEKLRVEFNPSNKKGDQLTGFKNVNLGQDTLWLNDDCCDQYSYFFVRSEVYVNEYYIQTNKSLDYIDVTNFDIGFSKSFTSLYFKNEDLGFITCYDGSILKTSNGGINWKITSTNNTLPLRGIAFTNENVGFAVGGESSCGGTGCIVPGYLILKTTDSGETWNKVDLPRNTHEFSIIKFINENTGFAIGTGLCLKTSDGGLTWKSINIDNLYAVYDLYFLNENIGYISCIRGKLFKTTDGGEIWQDISLNTDYQLYTVMFINEQIGYIGKWNSLIKTMDGGLSWQSIDYSPNGVQRMYFNSEENGVVFGARSYSSSEYDVWDSRINILVNGKWYGDERVNYHMVPFCLNPKQYYAITHDNKISIIKINN